MSKPETVRTCGECKFFTFIKSGSEVGRGFCRGGPISQLPIREANEFGSTHARPIYSAEEPFCVLFTEHEPAAQAKPDAECGKAGCQAEKIGLEDRAAAAEADAKRLRAALEHIDSAFNRSIHTLSDTERQAWTITRKALNPEAPDA
jgi:hypothetical protein